MKTILHHYYFNTDKSEECKAYYELRDKLEKSPNGPKFFNVYPSGKNYSIVDNKTEVVELDTSFIFDNQWNEVNKLTTKSISRRLFDWYEAIHPNKKLKEGHWLEITSEMETIRRETLTCGYCGKYVNVNDSHKWHCEKCLGSEYLKENDLGLLRLIPVCDSKYRSCDLEASERNEIIPLWKQAQGLGQIERDKAKASHNRRKVAALIPNAEKKAAELIEAAKVETKALTWLLDHEFNIIDNVIYYPHTKRFGFGWRTPLDNETKSKLLDVLSEFPFDYDLK